MGEVSRDLDGRFEAVYEAHRLDVLAYCTRRVGLVDGADACSETFLSAWRRLDDLPPAPGTLPYLYAIAARVIANQQRSRHRRSRLRARLAALGVPTPADPAAVLVQSVQDQHVVAAVRRLKPTDREIVMLYAWENLSREVIAELMGMSKAAIDQRIHRSYRRLARILKPAEAPTVDPPAIVTKADT